MEWGFGLFRKGEFLADACSDRRGLEDMREALKEYRMASRNAVVEMRNQFPSVDELEKTSTQLEQRLKK